MDMVRIGVIGLGGMGTAHASMLRAGQVPGAELTAVCDADAARLAEFQDFAQFNDSQALLCSGKADAVVIATPHYSHTTIGIAALKAGLHVLLEKPISVHKADCERLIAAHTNPKQVFAAMFNQRTDPFYRRIKGLIDSGELGAIQRVNWIITNWFRPDAYYASGTWRATWGGEGGGVLLNQCPHNLDLLQWLCGMPRRVTAFCGFGKYHSIEVEDEVTAYLEYANGATGVFITTTGEAPGTNRLEIAGDRGKIVAEGDKLTFTRNETPTREFCRATRGLFDAPAVWNVDLPVQGHGEQHLGILKNFSNAINTGEPLIAPAADGLHSVELANAMLYSAWTDKGVDLPLDGRAYARRLRALVAQSTAQKTKKSGKRPRAEASL
jgi:predicted dehydrogenase